MEELKEIIKNLKKILKQEKLTDVDANVLVDCAVRIYLSKQIEKGKNKRTEKRLESSNSKEPATKKQKWKLKQLGIEFDDDITKQEAYQLIKENN